MHDGTEKPGGIKPSIDGRLNPVVYTHGAPDVRRTEAIHLLLAGNSAEVVASEIGITVSRLRLWMRQVDFVNEYVEARNAFRDRVLDYLGVKAFEAIKTLATEMANPDNAARNRIAAADKILEYFKHFDEQHIRAQIKTELEEEITSDDVLMDIVRREAERRATETGETTLGADVNEDD